MNTKSPIILLTDFGLSDPYVGIMKGVILKIAPGTPIIDLTHQVSPQNIAQASFLLFNSYRFFPPGSIFASVVDPGVGTDRHPVLVKSAGYFFVGPDNGLFGFLNPDASKTVVDLTNHRYFLTPVSKTFHGRDIFASVAAHLSREGEKIIGDLGPRRSSLHEIPNRFPRLKGKTLEGRILHIDRFGNLITNIHRNHLAEFNIDPGKNLILFKETVLPFFTTFAEAPDDRPGVLIGSSSHLEIFVKNGNAEKILNGRIGDIIHVGKHHP